MRVAIVLAAGASRRMGRPKLALDLGGKTVLERSVQSFLDADVDQVRVVVAASTTPPSITGAEILVNPDPGDGLASSLTIGLRELPDETRVVLVALADKPLVDPATIDALSREFDRGGARVVYPVYRGEQGHPVLFDRSLVDELAAVSGDRGARAVVDAHASEARAVAVDDPGVSFDIDTPDDYVRATRQLSRDERPRDGAKPGGGERV